MNGILKVSSVAATTFLVLSAPAHCQTPQRTVAVYNDWAVSCSYSAEGKSCELTQSQYLEGQTSPTSQVTIGRLAKGQPIKIVFQVPANVWIEAGVNFELAEKSPLLKAAFRWCNAALCVADVNLDQSATNKLLARTEPVRLSWKDIAQRDVVAPVSLKGFAPAFGVFNEVQSASSNARPESSPKPESNAKADEARRFDGKWSTEAECAAIPPNTAKALWITPTKIENGKLSANYGIDGKPGSGRFEGTVAANGHVEVFVIGLTGESKFNTNNAPEGIPYSWKATGSLSDSRGTATKTEGRHCVLSFSKDKK